MRVNSIERRASIRKALLATTTTVLVLLSGASGLKAESTDSKAGEKGFVWIETFQGTSNALGTVTKLNNSGGYKFGPLFEVTAGLPLYFVRASSSSTAAGLTSVNGIGDPHVGLHFTLGNETTTLISSVTGTVPVADADKGLSTGRVTVDWNNYLEFDAGRISPFVDAGLANSISDTRFFTRPFTSLGKVAHFEGGAYFELRPALSLGASAYADAPFGEQKVYSKLVRRGQPDSIQPPEPSTPDLPPGSSAGSPGRGNGLGAGKGAFETQSVTVGDASIARDHGGSVWLDIYPGRFAGFQVGFSRSAQYDLNSVFFGIILDVGRWVRDRE